MSIYYHETKTVQASTAFASTTIWDSEDMGVTDRNQHLSVQVIYADAAPAAKTFLDANVDVDTNIITIASHGFVTGVKVAATSAGTLPGGLSATNYYVIYVTSGTIKLASTLANAEAGTAVDITSAAGGGTHTLTPATSSGNVIKLQASNVPSPSSSATSTEWTDVASATTTIATSSGSVIWTVAARPCRHYRVVYTPSAGQVTLGIYVCREELN
jgi:hypothetical protein